ncbi:MAG: Probable transcriptional regulatory protein YebC [uncultured Paraburkholderia sp.]|nr:MAG: Probable transcriptional regulatory protein YebC [uncultured Paraburkholderia sp.]CAH2781518.1 MAG: Probable transcriptional regulatory protein YebC [uncultured Paraburkholderia sp.]CAH2915051.1 MAG: Probable transcriptional regulatory protein YebC [uncultured Paraburkholderia sp.]CAH2916412.1 MAG: Probable transcriptional regulatory protein YebC [uncultured Paraburkholderia sp.]
MKAALEAAGFKAEVAEVTMKSQTEVEFTGDDAVKMQKLLDALENSGRRAGSLYKRRDRRRMKPSGHDTGQAALVAVPAGALHRCC